MKDRHGLEAAGGGDLGDIKLEKRRDVGPCPSCSEPLIAGVTVHPGTQMPAMVMMHPEPFCTYFGVTSPEQIEQDVRMGIRR